MNLDYAEALQTMLLIAREASALIARVYATDFGVQYKGPDDPVTEADRAANTLACERLLAAFGPEVALVAEESHPTTYANWREAQRVFFVDPLDGTAEFVRRNGDFVVMIGLAEAGRAVAGVLVAPALGVSWAAAVGLGAWEIDAVGRKQAISVSATSSLDQAAVVMTQSHPSAVLERAVAALRPARLLRRGSAGLKGADVATSRADVFIHPGPAGKRWDACAPEALVVAAGGRCTDALGAPIDYRSAGLTNDRGVLMTNGHLHDRVLERIQSAGLSLAKTPNS